MIWLILYLVIGVIAAGIFVYDSILDQLAKGTRREDVEFDGGLIWINLLCWPMWVMVIPCFGLHALGRWLGPKVKSGVSRVIIYIHRKLGGRYV